MSIASINKVREQLHEAGISDALRALSRREYFDHREVLEENPAPLPATWDDVEEHALTLPGDAARLRATAESTLLRAVVRARWLESAEDVERRWREHVASAEHARWLRDGGPARLWDVLAARLRKHEAAGLGYAVFAAAGTQKLMDEMVRIYLTQQEAVQCNG